MVLLPPHPLRHLLSPDSSYSNRCEERSVSTWFDLHFPGDLFRWVAHMHVHLFIFFEEMIIQILCEFLKICCHSGYWECPSLRFKSLIWYVFQTLPHFLGCSTPLNCVLCRQSIQVGVSLVCLLMMLVSHWETTVYSNDMKLFSTCSICFIISGIISYLHLLCVCCSDNIAPALEAEV